MRLLLADDDLVTRRLAEATLVRHGHEVVAAENGKQALERLTGSEAPSLAILDWMMPELDGPEVCRRIRARGAPYVYLLLLTARTDKLDVVAGLESGADDFLGKPVDPGELLARVNVGARVVDLERTLQQRVTQLEHALAEVTQLKGLLPICMHCNKIRNERDEWERLELFIGNRSGAQFSHSLCEPCLHKHYPET